MLRLKKDKEDELVKYGFTKETRHFKGFKESYYYKLGKSFKIEGYSCAKSYNNGLISASLTRINQDVLYDLIQDGIVEKIDTPTARPSIKLEDLQNRIQELEEELKKVKGEKPESWK